VWRRPNVLWLVRARRGFWKETLRLVESRLGLRF
jgi:hypothetical protein